MTFGYVCLGPGESSTSMGAWAECILLVTKQAEDQTFFLRALVDAAQETHCVFLNVAG